MIRQWIPECRSGNRKCTGPKDGKAITWNWQLMTSGRWQMLATRNFGDWHTVVGEVPWSSVLKTTMDRHSTLVLHSLKNIQLVQVIMHQPWQTMLAFPGPCEQTCCSILNMLQLVHNLLRCRRQDSYNSRHMKWQRRGLIVFIDSVCSEHRTRLSWQSQKKHADIWNMSVKTKVHCNSHTKFGMEEYAMGLHSAYRI